MDTVTVIQEQRILNSWKEIAAHLRLGVRTVQRYESQYGLPIRRFNGHSRNSVLGFAHEIDAWMRARPMRSVPVAIEDWERLVRSVEALQNEVRDLRKQNDDLRKQINPQDQTRRLPKLENGASRHPGRFEY